MPAPWKVDSKSESNLLLLVEGLNDCRAVFHLMWLIHGVEPVFGIHECGSDDRVLRSLASRVINPHPRQKVLGLVLDADIEGLNPSQVVKARLGQLVSRIGTRYPMPAAFPEEGLILSPLADRTDADRLPKLGVWLMPNNKAYGMFEDLLRTSLSDRVAAYATKVVKQVRADGIARYKDAHVSKAVIRTYMAWQDPPDVQYLGLAIQRGVFENIEAECRQFVQWLDRLFGSPTP
jgi:hypothetical protein